MHDAQIAALMAAGDRAGLAAAYDVYADRLHDYARSMLRTSDPEAAADVMHDTFLIAFAKAPGLRDPERLRPWLYAITRNECLRALRHARRTNQLEDDAAIDEGSSDMSANIASTDLKELVHAAAEGLSPRDREVFDLGMRHDLAGPEIAAALGVSDNVAHAMLSRVKTQLGRALGAFVVARDRSCPDLDALLTGWDGSFAPLWRKRIARHTDGCATCTDVQERELSPAALLSVVPLAAAPVALRSRLLDDQLDLVAASQNLLGRRGLYAADGFPVVPLPPAVYEIAPGRHREAPPLRRRGGWFFVAALLATILGFGLLQLVELLPKGDPDRVITVDGTPTATSMTIAPTATLSDQQPRPTRTPSPTVTQTPTPTPTPTSTLTASPEPTPSPTREPSPRPTPKPTPTKTTQPPAVGTLTVSPTTMTLARRGPDSSGSVRLMAVGGPVSWTASAPDGLFLDDFSGNLPEGEVAVVQITVDPNLPSGAQTFTVVFSPGAVKVTVVVP